MSDKMINLVLKVYMTVDMVIALNAIFSVETLTDDVGIAFDATMSGLNNYCGVQT